MATLHWSSQSLPLSLALPRAIADVLPRLRTAAPSFTCGLKVCQRLPIASHGASAELLYFLAAAFPLVFSETYRFNLGLSGLPFVGFVVALVPTVALYFAYQKYSVIPKFQRTGVLVPESRLLVALVGSAFIPVALFIFGWSAGRGHWMGPVVGASLYLPG